MIRSAILAKPSMSQGPQGGPSPTNPTVPRPATKTSPLPGPIRRSAAALPSSSPSSSASSALGAASAQAKSQSSKTLFDSYRSLSPNTRIAFGLAMGVVGIIGLYWDRWAAPEPAREGDKPIVSVRMVDRER